MIVKFCGATTEAEVREMAAAGADLVGLWHGVPGGRAELTAARLSDLAALALAGGRLRPTLVTFSSDTQALLATVAATRVPCLQLHGFQPPDTVRALRRDGPPGLEIVKVLHLRDDVCVEERLTGAYERAGADTFLMDTVTADGRLGSTAEPLTDTAVTALADRTGLPFLLAGGLHAGNADDFAGARAHPRFLGIDVDSAARAGDGLLRADRARAVAHAWRTA
ncbi:N-(5'-phosphoribosyl)anthranilate isomerase [Streptomyces fuscichromogenes]|uniref:phosphoribosylanthranilate isomerase n=1 Tax=Streptomyces fuscichromogenes TaxID=1324013 RepID=UPI0037F7547B